jgi:hypothetical protein
MDTQFCKITGQMSDFDLLTDNDYRLSEKNGSHLP